MPEEVDFFERGDRAAKKLIWVVIGPDRWWPMELRRRKEGRIAGVLPIPLPAPADPAWPTARASASLSFARTDRRKTKRKRRREALPGLGLLGCICDFA